MNDFHVCGRSSVGECTCVCEVSFWGYPQKETSYIFTEPDGLCGNQRYRRELPMMGMMMPETC